MTWIIDAGRFLMCVDNLADPNVYEYQFKDRGEVLMRGSALKLDFVAARFDEFRQARMEMYP
jgi:hypothetical protein